MKPSMSEAPGKAADQIYDAYGNEFHLPDYTISQVRAAIPKHCYQKSALRSLLYVVRDVASYALGIWLFEAYLAPATAHWPRAATIALRALYVLVQSWHMTGLWVLGHECGHQAFSPSGRLNDAVGYVLHSALLVPYFSWKITHSKHHKATNNLARDMGFMPKTKDELAQQGLSADLAELVEETPLKSAFWLLQQQVLGWWFYLLTNHTSHNRHEGQRQGRGIGKKDGFLSGVNHFSLNSPLFDNEHVPHVLASNVGLLTTLAVLVTVGKAYGWGALVVHYVLPYVLLNNWIVLITSLQHSDPSVPYYQPESWSWTRGSAATIDRDFGFVGRYFFHGIIETHVLHHHVPTIPFYHAAEASEAIKGVLGRHYRSDTRGGWRGYLGAAWTRMRYCRWVEPSSAKGESRGVMFYAFPRAAHPS